MAEQACLSKVKGLILQVISNLKMSIARLIHGFLRNQRLQKMFAPRRWARQTLLITAWRKNVFTQLCNSKLCTSKRKYSNHESTCQKWKIKRKRKIAFQWLVFKTNFILWILSWVFIKTLSIYYHAQLFVFSCVRFFSPNRFHTPQGRDFSMSHWTLSLVGAGSILTDNFHESNPCCPTGVWARKGHFKSIWVDITDRRIFF